MTDPPDPVVPNEIKLVEPTETDNPVIVLEGVLLKKKTVIYFPVTKDKQHWILMNKTNISVKYGKVGYDITKLSGVYAGSWKLICVSEKDLHEIGPRAVNNCVIEGAPPRTSVKVNTNAQGTVIRGWYLSDWNEDAIHKVVELMENDPITDERVPLEDPKDEYTPDTSRWCSYRFHLSSNATLLLLKNPTSRTIGTPLFLEFANALNRDGGVRQL